MSPAAAATLKTPTITNSNHHQRHPRRDDQRPTPASITSTHTSGHTHQPRHRPPAGRRVATAMPTSSASTNRNAGKLRAYLDFRRAPESTQRKVQRDRSAQVLLQQTFQNFSIQKFQGSLPTPLGVPRRSSRGSLARGMGRVIPHHQRGGSFPTVSVSVAAAGGCAAASSWKPPWLQDQTSLPDLTASQGNASRATVQRVKVHSSRVTCPRSFNNRT